MTADLVALLADLTARGVKIEAAEGKLRIDAPAGAITPELRECLAEHKAALLAHMGGDAQPTPTPPVILGRIPLDPFCPPSEYLAARGLRIVGGTPYFGGARRPVLYVADIPPAEVAA